MYEKALKKYDSESDAYDVVEFEFKTSSYYIPFLLKNFKDNIYHGPVKAPPKPYSKVKAACYYNSLDYVRNEDYTNG
jgi:hypothetical protein